MKPDNISNHYFEKYLHSMVLNLTVSVINIIPFFYKQKPGEIPVFRIVLAKNYILTYISLKIFKFGKIGNYDATETSYTGYF